MEIMEHPLDNPLEFCSDGEQMLDALFAAEAASPISNTYALAVRRDAFSRIREAAQPPSCVGRSVVYLAVTYLDRFLSKQQTLVEKPWVAAFLSVTCLSLAAKMLNRGFSIAEFQAPEPVQFDVEKIRRMELVVLGDLGWRMRSITPFSFLDFFLALFPSADPPRVLNLKDRASKIIFEAQNVVKMLVFKPSVIAACALLSAGEEFPDEFREFEYNICSCDFLNEEERYECDKVIEDVNMDGCDLAAVWVWV